MQSIRPLSRLLFRQVAPVCTRQLSDKVRPGDSWDQKSFSLSDSTVLAKDTSLNIPHRQRMMIKDQEDLFSDPAYFQTPVLMLHCQYTEFAVSFHAPDKLNELDCLWSGFPADVKVYGEFQRSETKTVQLLLARAKHAMMNYGVKECRVVFKGYQKKPLFAALEYLSKIEEFDFVSITDQTRKLGEESVVYQRPLPRYPVWKMPSDNRMTDGPEWTPQGPLNKFKRLNVAWKDKFTKGVGLTIKSTEAKASKRGFINKAGKAKGGRETVRLESLSGIDDILGK